MKTIKIAVVLLGLLASQAIPVAGSTNLSLFTWVHTSGGMGSGNPASAPDVYDFAFSPGYATDHTVYAGTYIGLHRSTDQGLTWTNLMPLAQTAITSLSVSPGDPTGNTLIGGTSDGIAWTNNRWDSSSNIGPAGIAVPFVAYSPDFVNDHIIYAGTDNNNGVRAKTGTGPWVSLDEGDVHGKVTEIVFDPNYAANHILYVASYGFGVYIGNGGPNLSNWSFDPLNTGLDSANQKFVSAIAISPNFAVDHTLMIATDSVGIYKSVDAGLHWTVAYDNLSFQTLLFSPNYATDRTIYAGEGGDGVFRSTDGGTTWNKMNQGFADIVHPGFVLTLAFAPGKPTHLFAGFMGGIEGGAWQFLLPASRVFIPCMRK
jgi:hypothetical protein